MVPHAPYVVDVGAWDGQQLSSVWALIARGYEGHLVGGNNDRARLAHRNTLQRPGVQVVTEFEGPDFTLAELLRIYGAPSDFAVLSIDIDGPDLAVLSTLGSSHRPHMVVRSTTRQFPNMFTSSSKTCRNASEIPQAEPSRS